MTIVQLYLSLHERLGDASVSAYGYEHEVQDGHRTAQNITGLIEYTPELGQWPITTYIHEILLIK